MAQRASRAKRDIYIIMTAERPTEPEHAEWGVFSKCPLCNKPTEIIDGAISLTCKCSDTPDKTDSALNARAAASFIRGVYVLDNESNVIKRREYWRYVRNDYKGAYDLLVENGKATECTYPDSQSTSKTCKHILSLTWKLNETPEYTKAMKVVCYVSEAVARGKVLHVARAVRSRSTKMKEEAK